MARLDEDEAARGVGTDGAAGTGSEAGGQKRKAEETDAGAQGEAPGEPPAKTPAETEAAAAPPNGSSAAAPEQALLLRVKRLSERAVLPKRGSEGAAGYDLASAEAAVVPARGKAIVKTDLSIAIPPGTYARIAPRSGLAAKHSIDVGAGVVDYDYRGNVGVILFNLSDKDFSISQGDRIAQLILERIVTPEVVEVDDLDETARGAGGFGSTGVAAKH